MSGIHEIWSVNCGTKELSANIGEAEAVGIDVARNECRVMNVLQVLDQITDRLYNQTMDAQDGVIYFLLDQMADQHVKEQLLAYFALLANGTPDLTTSFSLAIQKSSC